MLIAGPILWVVGSIHNSCQIYERADRHLQILQQGVHIPFLIGSVLFAVGSIINCHGQAGSARHHGRQLLGKSWMWLGTFGTLFLVIGGFMNLVKVFKMQQGDRVIRLEMLRGGAQELLARQREGQVLFVSDDHRRQRREAEEEAAEKLAAVTAQSTPYKDVLVGHSQA